MTRDLTEKEITFLKLVNAYEEALTDKRLTFSISLAEEGVKGVWKGEEAGLFKVMNITEIAPPAGLPEQKFIVKFQINEFEKYLQWLTGKIGMTYDVNYRVVFSDGYQIQM